MPILAQGVYRQYHTMATDSLVISRYVQLMNQVQLQAQNHGETWRSWADPSTPSPAQYGEVIDEQVAWWPTRMTTPVDFSGLAKGLEIEITPQLMEFYSVAYGAGLPVVHAKGDAELLMVWHDQDALRLQENLIAHVLMKRRLKQRDTLFFAVTDDDDYMISVLNCTGEVYLERVGHEVEQKLADSIADFLTQLAPRPA